MFQLRKLHAPFGTRDAPVFEGSYSEGIIPVVEGLCTVKNQDSRDYLLKMGYVDAAQAKESATATVAAVVANPQVEPKPEPKRGVVRKILSRLRKKGRR